MCSGVDILFLGVFVAHLAVTGLVFLMLAPSTVEAGAWVTAEDVAVINGRIIASCLLGSGIGAIWAMLARTESRRFLVVFTQPIAAVCLVACALSLAIGSGRVVEPILLLLLVVADSLWSVRVRARMQFVQALLTSISDALAANPTILALVGSLGVVQLLFMIYWSVLLSSILRQGGSVGHVAVLVVAAFVSLRWTTSVIRRAVTVAVAGAFTEHVVQRAAAQGVAVRLSLAGGFFADKPRASDGKEICLNPGPGSPAMEAVGGAAGERSGRAAALHGIAGVLKTDAPDEAEAAGIVAAAEVAAGADWEDGELDSTVIDIDLGDSAPPAPPPTATLTAEEGGAADAEEEEVEVPAAARRGPMGYIVCLGPSRLGSVAAEALLSVASPPLWPCLRCLHRLERSHVPLLSGCASAVMRPLRAVLRRSHPFAFAQVAMSGAGWLRSAEQTWGRIEEAGAEAVVADDAVHRLLVLACYIGGIVPTLVTANFTESEGARFLVTATAVFLCGFFSTAICLAPWEAAASALVTIFAAAPAALARVHPVVYHRYSRLAEMWRLRRTGAGRAAAHAAAMASAGAGGSAWSGAPAGSSDSAAESTLSHRERSAFGDEEFTQPPGAGPSLVEMLADEDDGSGTSLA